MLAEAPLTHFTQSIREIYPCDGTVPHSRMDLLDMEMQLSLHDLGRQEGVSALRGSIRFQV